MARIAHKIKGSAATIGFPEFTQLAVYFERAVFAFQHGESASESMIVVTLGRFFELFDTCLAAAAALESPDSIVVVEAQQLLDVAFKISSNALRHSRQSTVDARLSANDIRQIRA